jgi:hypothetical protein
LCAVVISKKLDYISKLKEMETEKRVSISDYFEKEMRISVMKYALKNG